MAEADLISLSAHAFEKEGEQIHCWSAELTKGGYAFDPGDIPSLAVTLRGGIEETRAKIQAAGKKRAARQVIRQARSVASENPRRYDVLREWRAGMGKKKGLPAFRIFTNRVPDHLASDLPTSDDELHTVQGVGPHFAERYGKEIIRIVKAYVVQNGERPKEVTRVVPIRG